MGIKISEKKTAIKIQHKKTAKNFFLIAFSFATVLALNYLYNASQAQAVTYPAQILDLTNWKETLPTGSSESPTEIKQASLSTYSANPYFMVNSSGNAVLFRAPVNGVTTSGSGYPRSELREMTNNGKTNASWSTTSGTHTIFIDQAITAVPKTKKHIVAGQIHDADDDVIAIRLEYPKLFIDINGKTGPTLDSNYTLGKRFTVRFVTADGKIKVYYNGNQTPSYTMSKSGSGYYFKAGAYTQSNCSKEKDCSSNNYGEVAIYNLSLQNQVPVPILTSSAASLPTPPTMTPTSAPTAISSDTSFEAEAGNSSGGMTVLSDDTSASGGKYIQANSSGYITYPVSIPTTGTYRVAGWIKTSGGSSDSFYVSLDGKSSSIWTLVSPAKVWTYDVHDGKTFSLNQGTHTITLKYREKGAKIDKLVLVKQ